MSHYSQSSFEEAQSVDLPVHSARQLTSGGTQARIDLDGKIMIDGRPVEPLQGRLYLVGVTERKVNLLERLLLDMSDPGVDFGPAPTGAATGPQPRSHASCCCCSTASPTASTTSSTA